MKKRTTIRRQIYHLVLFLILFLSAVIVCVIVWDRLSVYNSEKLTDQFLAADGYFEGIDSAQSTLNQYLSSLDESEYEAAEAEINACLDTILQMQDMLIMSNNARESADLYALTESYLEAAQALHIYIEETRISSQDAALMALYSEEYQELSEIRNYIMQQKTAIFSGIQLVIREQRALWDRRDKIFFAELLAICFVLIIMAVRKAASLTVAIVHPVEVLTEGAVRISEGSLEQIQTLELTAGDENEISFLIRVFNQMLERIKDQVQKQQKVESMQRSLLQKELENAKVRETLRTSELRRLQTQINSHFLFNTLSMITQTAYLENADKTVDLMQTTATFLRYSLDCTERLVTLAREMEALGCYITLQEQRFGKRLRFYFDLEEACHQARIPALTLQPIVENAIIHGVGGRKQGGSIWIKTSHDKTNGQVCIRISDDGAGMEEEVLVRLRASLQEPDASAGKIGLANVYQRLLLYYPDGVCMKIESSPAAGTSVELRIPDTIPENGRSSGALCNSVQSD